MDDEPTGSLDSTTSMQSMELREDLHQEGQTIVMVTHNPDNIPWFDRAIAWRDGCIVGDAGQQLREKRPKAV